MNLNRGFSCIALDNPKDKNNVGGAMRAAFVYEANLVVIGNGRFERSATDVFETWRNAPVLRVADVFDALPYDTVPVGVDLVDGATPLPDYEHPRRAFYVFGAEDATLGERILGRCRDRIFIPMRGCMNLAACVNVVLYDRMAKQMRNAASQARMTA